MDPETGEPYPIPKAFEPKFDQERARFERSVFRTDGLTDEEIWGEAAAHVEASRHKPVIARAEVSVANATVESLSVVADEPPKHHAVIIGWPEGDDAKLARKNLQQLLAAEAKLLLRPGS